MRIANVDMRNENSDCPTGLQLSVIEEEGCVSHHLNQHSIFKTGGVEYSRVYGRVIGYQYFTPIGFTPSRYHSTKINTPYVEESITQRFPR